MYIYIYIFLGKQHNISPTQVKESVPGIHHIHQVSVGRLVAMSRRTHWSDQGVASTSLWIAAHVYMNYSRSDWTKVGWLVALKKVGIVWFGMVLCSLWAVYGQLSSAKWWHHKTGVIFRASIMRCKLTVSFKESPTKLLQTNGQQIRCWLLPWKEEKNIYCIYIICLSFKTWPPGLFHRCWRQFSLPLLGCPGDFWILMYFYPRSSGNDNNFTKPWQSQT